MKALPSGRPLLQQTQIYKKAEEIIRDTWDIMKAQLDPLLRPAAKAATAILKTRTFKFMKSAAGPVLLVVDIAGNAYFTYQDYGRWQEGEISGEYFSLKATLRAAQTGVTIAAIGDPEPLTKVVCVVSAVVLVAADLVSDPMYEAAAARTRQLLGALERDERYHYCRTQLLAEMQRISNASTSMSTRATSNNVEPYP